MEESGPWNDFLQRQNFSLSPEGELEEQSPEEWNDSSTLDENESASTEHIQAEINFAPKTKKTAKAERKRVRHQNDVEIIAPKDLEELDLALHPGQSLLTEQKRRYDSQGLAQNRAIENNITFNSRTFNYGKFRSTAQGKKTVKEGHTHRSNDRQDAPEQRKALLDPVLQKLRLNADLTRATKERRTLDHKLREAIYDDIVAVTNEQAETMQRMAGYWRYANRRTYNAMVLMNEIWDW